MEASKEGKILRDFRYGCIGYSLYADQKKRTPDAEQSEPELPVCIGLEVSVIDWSLLCVLVTLIQFPIIVFETYRLYSSKNNAVTLLLGCRDCTCVMQ